MFFNSEKMLIFRENQYIQKKNLKFYFQQREYMITQKERIKKALNALKRLQLTDSEKRKNLWFFKKMFLMRLQSHQTKSFESRIAGQYSETQLLLWIVVNLLDQSMEF